MADGLTHRQRKLLRFIAQSTREKGWAPTIREMCQHFKWASTHSAHCHIGALEKKGVIVRVKGYARAIRITEQGEAALS